MRNEDLVAIKKWIEIVDSRLEFRIYHIDRAATKNASLFWKTRIFFLDSRSLSLSRWSYLIWTDGKSLKFRPTSHRIRNNLGFYIIYSSEGVVLEIKINCPFTPTSLHKLLVKSRRNVLYTNFRVQFFDLLLFISIQILP